MATLDVLKQEFDARVDEFDAAELALRHVEMCKQLFAETLSRHDATVREQLFAEKLASHDVKVRNIFAVLAAQYSASPTEADVAICRMRVESTAVAVEAAHAAYMDMRYPTRQTGLAGMRDRMRQAGVGASLQQVNCAHAA